MYSECAINSIVADLQFSKFIENLGHFTKIWYLGPFFAILAAFWLFLSIFGENLPEVV